MTLIIKSLEYVNHFSREIICIHVRAGVDFVVQFYPWLKSSFLLFLGYGNAYLRV